MAIRDEDDIQVPVTLTGAQVTFLYYLVHLAPDVMLEDVRAHAHQLGPHEIAELEALLDELRP